MAGGTWDLQNKGLPGVYINIKSAAAQLYSFGDRGVVTLCKPLSWGAVGQIITIEAGANTVPTLGYDVNTAPELHFLRELFRGTESTNGASKVLLYRPMAEGATQAGVTVGELTVTARYPGIKGNNIIVTIYAMPDSDSVFTIQTSVNEIIVDQQEVSNISELIENAWVSFSGNGQLTPSAAVPLVGGNDGTISASAYSSYLAAIEPFQFDVLVYDGTDNIVKAAFATFIKRLREQEGRKCQAVLGNYPSADYEGIISVTNGLVLSDGTILTPGETAWWVAGCTAGAAYHQSLTYKAHTGAVDVSPKLTNTQMVDAIKKGGLVLMEETGTVKIVSDKNTLVTLSPDKGQCFQKNRVIRVLDAIANDIYRIFSDYYIGKVDNNADGRSLLKKEIVGYINEMQANSGVTNFSADDVTVRAGSSIDAVIIDLAIQPVDAVEKIYLTVTVS